MKKIICLLLAVIMLAFALCSCGKTESKNADTTEAVTEEKYPSGGIEGYWQGEFDGQNALVFLDYDGEGRMYCYSGSYNFYLDLEWSTYGSNISLTMDGETVNCEYTLDGDTLKLGEDMLERTTEESIPENPTDLAEYSNSLAQ